MPGFRSLYALLILALLAIPVVAASAYAQKTGPAADKIIWKRVPLQEVVAAITKGEIDLYFFGLRVQAAQQLVGKPGVVLYTAPAGLVDIGLNPAAVLVVELKGKYDRAAAAAKLGVDPIVVAYVQYDKEKDVTVVDLCAKPKTLPPDVKVVMEAKGVDINPFCFREIRFALNYIVDRDYIVKNIYKGFAIPRYAVYGPSDPTYTELIDLVAKYKFTYNPALAKRIVTEVLTKAGAELRGGTWYYNGKPIKVIGIIRVEDERRDIGDLFATELEKLGFRVVRLYLTFREAIPKVYFTNPIDFEWFFYTEGWGRGALDRWDPWMLAQFAAPWLGWCPGWGEPTYWNYKNETIDKYSIATALMKGIRSKEQWIEYLRKGVELAIQESIRIWIADVETIFPARAEVKGITLDLGAGLRNPFTLREMYVPGRPEVKVGHLWVWTAGTVWNPFGGFDDVYSVDPERATHDPWIWRHPFNGEPIPLRVTFYVETAGPEGKLKVPDDAIWWDPDKDAWVYAKELGRTEATSKVVFDLSMLIGSSWHHGRKITFADILAYWAEWLEIVYDKKKSQIEAAIASTNKPFFDMIVAIRPLIKEKKLEVYINYWHFDPAYIADMAVLAPPLPMELIFAADYLAFAKKAYALDETRAKKENIPQLNYVLPDHAKAIVEAVEEIASKPELVAKYKKWVTLPDGTVPVEPDGKTFTEVIKARAKAVSDYVAKYGVAWISDGPFKLVKFDTKAQVLELEAFRSPDYPFSPGKWYFGTPRPTKILEVYAPLIEPGRKAVIVVSVSGVPPIHVKYVLRDPLTGKIILTGEAKPGPTGFVIELPKEVTDKLAEYAAYELIVVAYSEEVTLPTEKVVILKTTARISEKIAAVEKSVKEVRESVKKVSETVSELGEKVGKISETVSELGKTVGELEESVAGLAKSLEELRKAMQEQQEALRKALGEQVAKALAEVSQTVEAGFKSIRETLAGVTKTLEGVQSGLAAVQEGLAGVKGALDQVRASLESVSKGLTTLGDTVSKGFDDVKKDIKGLSDKLDSTKKAVIDAVSEKLDDISKKLDSVSTSASTAMALAGVDLALIIACILLVLKRTAVKA